MIVHFSKPAAPDWGSAAPARSAFCDKKATKAQIESFSRVLAALRELPAGVTLPREDADKLWKDQIQLAACITSLDDDGLIEILDGGLRLPN